MGVGINSAARGNLLSRCLASSSRPNTWLTILSNLLYFFCKASGMSGYGNPAGKPQQAYQPYQPQQQQQQAYYHYQPSYAPPPLQHQPLAPPPLAPLAHPSYQPGPARTQHQPYPPFRPHHHAPPAAPAPPAGPQGGKDTSKGKAKDHPPQTTASGKKVVHPVKNGQSPSLLQPLLSLLPLSFGFEFASRLETVTRAMRSSRGAKGSPSAGRTPPLPIKGRAMETVARKKGVVLTLQRVQSVVWREGK